jgi:hypothetical protein
MHLHGRCAHLLCAVVIIISFPFPGFFFSNFRLESVAAERWSGLHAVGAISVALFADDFFSVADPFLNFAGVLFRFP